MSTPWTGGCSCGAIRYECNAAPLTAFNCHCKACQHYTGSAFMSASLVPTPAFTITKGTLKLYTAIGDNGSEISRGFCETCGSPVATRLARLPQVVGVPAGSMDDPSIHKPAMDLFTRDALHWVCMDQTLPQFDLAPPPRQP